PRVVVHLLTLSFFAPHGLSLSDRHSLRLRRRPALRRQRSQVRLFGNALSVTKRIVCSRACRGHRVLCPLPRAEWRYIVNVRHSSSLTTRVAASRLSPTVAVGIADDTALLCERSRQSFETSANREWSLFPFL